MCLSISDSFHISPAHLLRKTQRIKSVCVSLIAPPKLILPNRQIISRCHRSSISRLDKLQHNSTQSFQETNKQKKSSKRCQRLKLDLFLNGKIACLSGTLVMQRADLTPFVSLLDDDEHEWIIRTCRKASDETTEHKPKP